MMSRINRFLGRQFGAQHSGHQTDIKIRQHAAQVLLLRQNGRIGNHRSVRNHKKCHVKRKRKRRPVKRLPQRKRPALFFRVSDSDERKENQRRNGHGKNGQKCRPAAHAVLNLYADERTERHSDGNGQRKAADAFGHRKRRQHIAGQCHGSGSADRINGPHKKPDRHQKSENRKNDKRGKGKRKKSQKNKV